MKKKVRLLYVISGLDYSLGIIWLDQYLDRDKYDPVFVFLNAEPPQLLTDLTVKGTDARFISLKSKKDYPLVFMQLLRLISSVKPAIVHTHLFDANMLGITAAWMLRVPKRIYTRHHSTYHHDYFPGMVKYDKLINALSTHIASISQNVSDVLVNTEKVPEGKIFLVRHGFVLDDFIHPDAEKVDRLRSLYNADARTPVIGVIARFTSWKGIQYIIPAFKKVLETHPESLLVLANAKGEYEAEINVMLAQIPENAFLKITFEKDLFSLYQLFDIFVHVPVDAAAEAFGQVYVEALAAGIPSVFTLSGIAREFISDEVNALVVPFKDEMAIADAILRLLKEEPLRDTIIKNGRAAVVEKFQVENMMTALYKMYES